MIVIYLKKDERMKEKELGKLYFVEFMTKDCPFMLHNFYIIEARSDNQTYWKEGKVKIICQRIKKEKSF